MTQLRIRERAHQVVLAAEFGVGALYWLCALFISIVALILCLPASHASVLLGILVLVAAYTLIHALSTKKKSVSELLHQAEHMIDGEIDCIADFLKKLVDEALGSVALSFAVLPAVLVGTALVLIFLHYNGTATALFVAAIVFAVLATCVYGTVHCLAFREVDWVVASLKEHQANEETGLIAK